MTESAGDNAPHKYRTQTHEMVIQATREEVWQALTEAEGIARWFTTKADVEPGAGGRIRYTWEEMAAEADSRIEVWEPGKRLLLRHLHAEGSESTGNSPLLEEWTIEDATGGTLLKLVQSHVPAAGAWDEFYDSTHAGWLIYLEHLKHGLTRAKGRPRLATTILYPLALDRKAAWQLLTGDDGLAVADGEVTSGVVVRLPASLGGVEATVCYSQPPTAIVLTVNTLADPLLAVLLEGDGPTFLWAQASVYPLSSAGDAGAKASAWGEKAVEWIRALLPPAE
jgi:uncharacterized protein YndB with AHSA1/START domain